MGKSNKTKKKAPAASSKAKASSSSASSSSGGGRFLTCPSTGDRVFVGTATLQDIKHPPSSQKRKLLLKVPSAKTRAELYDELSLCLEDMETRLLPKYGGRPWQVICRVQDNGSSPFFRWFRGNLEIAVIPHLLEKIPAPPKFPGYEQTEHGVRRIAAHNPNADSDDEDDDDESVYENLTEAELQRMESLQNREISSLSQVAWDHRNDKTKGAPIPTIAIKWICPLRQIFTSRKAAWDHALELAKAEQYIDRYLRGRGARSILLKPFRPTRAQTLQAGKVRFLRDGLWVVGQEQQWQLQRLEEMEEEKRQADEAVERAKERKQLAKEEKKQAGASSAATAVAMTKRKRLSPIALFLHVNRQAYKEKRLKELAKEAVAAPKAAINQEEPTPEEESTTVVSKTADKVGLPPAKKKPKKQAASAVAKISFTMRDAENELRDIFKALPERERLSWEARAETSFYRKLELDEQARIEAAQDSSSEDEEESESEDGSDMEEEEDSDADAAEEEEEGEKEAGDNQDEQGKEEEQEDEASEAIAIELATEEDRSIWELFSEAEQKVWGKRFVSPPKPQKKKAPKKNPALASLPISASAGPFEEKKEGLQDGSNTDSATGPSDPKVDNLRLSYDEYQSKVFHSLFDMSKKEYEREALKNMKAPVRRKVLQQQRDQEKLKEQGMRQFLPNSHALMKSRVEKWAKESINRAHNRNEKLAKEEAVKKAAAVVQIASQELPTKADVTATAVSTITTSEAPGNKVARPDPPAFMASVAPTTSAKSPAIDPPVEFRSAPSCISPSPTLVEPTMAQQGASSKVESAESKVPDTDGSACLDKKRSRDDDEKESEESEEQKPAPELLFNVTKHYCLNDKQINMCKEACIEHFDAVMRTVKAKDLTRELVDGFDVLRERGRGRYDMELPAFDREEFSFLTDIKRAPWMPIVRQVLGDDVVLIHKGCFLSLPGAENQNYHQDGPHLHPTSQRPCHAVNVFIPLVDMTRALGPTEFCLGSHVLGQEDWDSTFLETPLPKKGFPVMFDYRLGHRGLGNTSSREPRPIVYCSYAKAHESGKEWQDSINFSRRRYRKLGELVEKPLSREERSKKRRTQKDDAYYESLF